MTQRTRTRQLVAAQTLLGPNPPLRTFALGFSGANPLRASMLLVGGDIALLVGTYLLTGRMIGLGLLVLALILISVNRPRALGVTDSEVVVFRRSLWNGQPTAVQGRLGLATLVATPIPDWCFVAVGAEEERVWVSARDYERLVSRASLV